MTDTLRATRPDHADTTGIYVRAVGLNGRWGSHDIAELDAPSLLAQEVRRGTPGACFKKISAVCLGKRPRHLGYQWRYISGDSQ